MAFSVELPSTLVMDLVDGSGARVIDRDQHPGVAVRHATKHR